MMGRRKLPAEPLGARTMGAGGQGMIAAAIGGKKIVTITCGARLCEGNLLKCR